MAYASFAVLAFLVCQGAAINSDANDVTENNQNPIRRVVKLLQKMQKKVTEEGAKEEELYKKFQCYCRTGAGDLSQSIATADAHIGQTESALKEAQASKAQLEGELEEHKANRADAKDTIAKATALREKEAAAYQKESGELNTNLAALAKAITAIENGATGAFLQTTAGATLRHITTDFDMSSVDRDMLSSFLSTHHEEGYVPQSGQITGILKEIKDTMEKNLADVNAQEQDAVKTFNELVAAKTKELNANQAAIESKTQRHGEVSVEIVNMQEDLDDTAKALLDDKKFLADLDKNCDAKKAEWEERSALRAQELVALADTIKILNDDDALELFKKTLPSASSAAMLQTSKETHTEIKRQALQALGAKDKRPRDSRLDLIALTLRGKSGGFEKVVKMIDDMVAILGKEQKDDDEKKAYCETELDKSEDEKKALDQKASDLELAIEEAEGSIATLTDDISGLAKSIKALDAEVADATANREAEHNLYVETMAADNAAKELIGIAKNRLAKFYTPKLYSAPPARELTEEERISSNMGVELAPTEAPGGIANTGVTYVQEAPMFAQINSHTIAHKEAPPPPPETWDAYTKKGEEHSGVVGMMELLLTDLEKDMASATTEEKDAQAEYEQYMSDSATKRRTDTKLMGEKEGYKADLEAEHQKMTGEHKGTVTQAMAKAEFIHGLHAECDWLIANFATRQEARSAEIESLKNAKAVLAGADFSLAQVKAHSSLRGA